MNSNEQDLQMQTALKALAENMPLDWLLGRALRDLASRGVRHHLLNCLSGANPHAVQAWNSWISEFKSVLAEPEMAPRKADAELSKCSAQRVTDFLAEILSVVQLSRLGYSAFEPVLASGSEPAVDFMACRDEKRVRVEIKNLQEPQDIIRTVVWKRWDERRKQFPAKYDFSIAVSHDHIDLLSNAEISKLKTAIDQFPDMARREYSITLDGGDKVTLKRIEDIAGDTDPLNKITGPNVPRIVIASTITERHLAFNVTEYQNLFLKSLHTVCDATPKFFGRRSDPDAENVIVIRWTAPNGFYDDQVPVNVATAIANAFTAVGLELTIFVLGSDPEPAFNRFGLKNFIREK
ncbi:MAG TPA: hypothetical protein VFB79_11220 [Candidatus Angelobacter sp.]|nr:hypothetical protein [Candidatus Angelobacter sp.]